MQNIMQKDLNNVLAYFDLNSKVENNELHILDNTGLEYDIYECTTDPFLVPKKSNNFDTIFRLEGCHILIVPNGTTIQESNVCYNISLMWQDGVLLFISAEKLQRSNQDRHDIITTEISLNQEINYDRVIELIKNTIDGLVKGHIEPEGYLTDDDKSEIIEYVNTNFFKSGKALSVDEIDELNEQEVIGYLSEILMKRKSEFLYKLVGIKRKSAFIKEFNNSLCSTLYTIDEKRDNLFYEAIDEEGKTHKSFNIQFQYFDNVALISSHINVIENKETVLPNFEQSQIFQKMLTDYFPKLNEQYHQLKNGEMKYSIYNRVHDTQEDGRTI